MLIKAKVENFKSFDETTEFSMLASNRIRTPQEDVPKHKVEIDGVAVLKSAAIYGANAAGKSNLVDFFLFFKKCVTKGLPLKSGQYFCKTKESNEFRESTFELQFYSNGKFYAYGFSALLSHLKITSEWLYELLPHGGSAKQIFTREGENKPELGSFIKESPEKTRFEIYIDDFDPQKNSLFLSEMNRGKKLTGTSEMAYFNDVYNWFNDNLIILKPSIPISYFQSYYDKASLAKINDLITTFDTGISKIGIKKITVDELRASVPYQLIQELQRRITEIFNSDGKVEIIHSMRSDKAFFNFKIKKGGEPKITTLELKHGNSFFDFEFNEESDGTRRLFDLIDMLVGCDENTVFVVDELERSLHPQLTRRFIELFMELHKGKNTQLMFTTHESTIMDQDLFRRDEIWFVERDFENRSHIYSLDRFKERYDKKLNKAYLEGRYGAIPVFSAYNRGEEEE